MPKEDYNDFFDGDATENEENGEAQKKEEETPEQIEAKEIERQTIGKPASTLRKAIAILVTTAIIAVAVWTTIVFGVPYVNEAQQRGAIVQVRQEGLIFQTFEGQMITDERLADTVHVYQRDFFFSIEDDSIARDLMELQSTGRRVTLSYKEYRGALPWRGSSKIIVTGYKIQ